MRESKFDARWEKAFKNERAASYGRTRAYAALEAIGAVPQLKWPPGYVYDMTLLCQEGLNAGQDPQAAAKAAFEKVRPAVRIPAVNFANRAQAAAGISLNAAEWLEMEGITHRALPASTALANARGEKGMLDFASGEDMSVWAAISAPSLQAEDFASIFEKVIQGMLLGRISLAQNAPGEIKYLVQRAMRVARLAQ